MLVDNQMDTGNSKTYNLWEFDDNEWSFLDNGGNTSEHCKNKTLEAIENSSEWLLNALHGIGCSFGKSL